MNIQEEKQYLADKYKIIQKYNQPGSLGLTYKVEYNNQYFSVKEVQEDKIRKFVNFQDFFQLTLQRMQNKYPHYFVKYQEIVKDENTRNYFLVYEYQEMNLSFFLENLFQQCKQQKINFSQNEQIIQKVFSNIVNVYDIMIQENLLFKNIKPQNIFVNPNNQNVKIADYEILKYSNMNSHFKYIKMLEQNNSIKYQAPENIQLNSQCIGNEEFEIWTLGVILFQLVFTCKIFPFCGENAQDILHNIKQKIGYNQKFNIYEVISSNPVIQKNPEILKTYTQYSQQFKNEFEDLLQKIFVLNQQNQFQKQIDLNSSSKKSDCQNCQNEQNYENQEMGRISLRQLKNHNFVKKYSSNCQLKKLFKQQNQKPKINYQSIDQFDNFNSTVSVVNVRKNVNKNIFLPQKNIQMSKVSINSQEESLENQNQKQLYPKNQQQQQSTIKNIFSKKLKQQKNKQSQDQQQQSIDKIIQENLNNKENSLKNNNSYHSQNSIQKNSQKSSSSYITNNKDQQINDCIENENQNKTQATLTHMEHLKQFSIKDDSSSSICNQNQQKKSQGQQILFDQFHNNSQETTKNETTQEMINHELAQNNNNKNEQFKTFSQISGIPQEEAQATSPFNSYPMSFKMSASPLKEMEIMEKIYELDTEKEQYVSVLQFDCQQLQCDRIESYYYQDIFAYQYLGNLRNNIQKNKKFIQDHVEQPFGNVLFFMISKLRLYYTDRILYNLEIKNNIPKYKIEQHEFLNWTVTQSYQKLLTKVQEDRQYAKQQLLQDVLNTQEKQFLETYLAQRFKSYKGKINWQLVLSNDIKHISKSKLMEEPFNLIVGQCFKHFLKMGLEYITQTQKSTLFQNITVKLLIAITSKNIFQMNYRYKLLGFYTDTLKGDDQIIMEQLLDEIDNKSYQELDQIIEPIWKTFYE